MVGWHHRLDGHEFEQALGDGEGRGSLAGYSPWARKSWTMRLNHHVKWTASGDLPSDGANSNWFSVTT